MELLCSELTHLLLAVPAGETAAGDTVVHDVIRHQEEALELVDGLVLGWVFRIDPYPLNAPSQH
jgi:hypothetical protein